MYFTEFESFTQAQESAKSFAIEVMLVDGSRVMSSVFPPNVYGQALADIAAVEELKTMLAVWNRDQGTSGAITFIPYERIQTINILFGPSK